jgi:hypothetical protein
MKKFQELTIKTTAAPDHTAADIAAFLPSTWARNADREADLVINMGGKFFCFEIKSTPIGGARLWATPSEKGLAVTNIVPSDKSELTPDEYNEILNLFIRQGVEGHFQYEVTKPEVKLTDLINSESADKFRRFSSSANKSTGHSHPMDESRWMDFLYSIVKHDESLETDELVFFLREDGWDEESAQDLAADFSYGFRAMKYALDATERE